MFFCFYIIILYLFTLLIKLIERSTLNYDSTQFSGQYNIVNAVFVRNRRIDVMLVYSGTNTEIVEIKKIGLHPNSKFRTCSSPQK